jgi:hypothetical protein
LPNGSIIKLKRGNSLRQFLKRKSSQDYVNGLEKTFSSGTNDDRKKLAGDWVEKIEMAPDTLQVEVTYKLPELKLHSTIAGA